MCVLFARLLLINFIIQTIMTDDVLKPIHECCWPDHAKLIQNKNSVCIHHSTVWPVSYITSLVESLTRIGSPLLLFMTITGTLDRFHKGYNIIHGITIFLNTRRVLVSGATQWTWSSGHVLPPEFCHVRSDSRVTFSSQVYLQQTPTGLTYENLPGGPRPEVYNNKEFIMSESPACHHCIWFISTCTYKF